jgi:thiamine pyrophosphate-dependent acetolactate synthase large subunit-like protein
VPQQLPVFHTSRSALPGSLPQHLELADAMSAAYAADGWARVRGEPALVVTADWTEALEAVAALPCAWGDRVRLVALNVLAPAEIDLARETYEQVTRARIAVRASSDLASLAAQVRAALDLEAPVQVACAAQHAAAALAILAEVELPPPPTEQPDPAQVQEIAKLLDGLVRPVLVVGRRAALELAPALVADLARKLIAPIVLTVNACAMPPARLAAWRALASDEVVFVPAASMAWLVTLLECDGILAIESVLSEADGFGLHDFPLVSPLAKLARVGREPLGDADLARPTVVVRDLAGFLRALLDAVPAPGDPIGKGTARRLWRFQSAQRRRTLNEEVREFASKEEQKGGLHPAVVARRIADGRPRDAVMLAEGNGCGMWLWSLLEDDAPRVYPGLMANIGVMLAWAAGVRLGAPGVPIWGVLGDGSLLYQLRLLGELARAPGAGGAGPLVLFLFDNRAWDSIRLEQTFLFESRYIGTDLADLDYSELARVFGCDALRASTVAELDTAIQKARTRSAGDPPLVVDVRVPSDTIPFAGLTFALAELDLAASKLPDRLFRSLGNAGIPRAHLAILMRLVVPLMGP